MKRTIYLSMLAVLALAISDTSVWAGPWAAHHPRRVQVGARLHHENVRILHNYRQGNITADEARSLHSQVRSVRLNERSYAQQHDGHITKSEQRALNQQANAVSRQIYDTARD